MTMATMITSSPEDLNNLSNTIRIIKFVDSMIADGAHIQYEDVKISKEEIEHTLDYYSCIYQILTNPGMTQQQLSDYEESESV